MVFLWSLSRLSASDNAALGCTQGQEQPVPGWSGFCALSQVDQPIPPSSVGYMPVIPASPTELSTVYTMLHRSMSTADRFGQHSVVIVFDQAIYAKALEIIWKHQADFERVVLRMGAFHIACTFMAVIGKRFGDALLRDILVKSHTVGPSVIHTVLNGKHYNRAMRCHQLALEAILRVQW